MAPPADLGNVDALVRDRARALGFDAVAVARADVALDEEAARYRAFLDAGMHGEMTWLAANADVRTRLDTGAILEGARSVVCVARRYQRSAGDEANDPPFAQHVARYARGRDYHNVTRKKLRQLAAFLRTLGTDDHPVRARPMVDDAPVLERAWAARAGLGFVGKNGLLIVPGEGSFVLLGEVVTTLALTPDAPMAERCGSCTRCLDACPTRAFERPFVLDPRRCVAYLTIEHRSPIAEDLRESMGGHLFGCDDCQTVCPFNQSSRARATEATRSFEPHARWQETELVDLLTLDEPRWSALSEGSPLHRATADGLARNAAIVIGNTADCSQGAGTGAEGEGEGEGGGEGEGEGGGEGSKAKAALENAARAHPSATVRDAAAWGVARLERRRRSPRTC